MSLQPLLTSPLTHPPVLHLHFSPSLSVSPLLPLNSSIFQKSILLYSLLPSLLPSSFELPHLTLFIFSPCASIFHCFSLPLPLPSFLSPAPLSLTFYALPLFLRFLTHHSLPNAGVNRRLSRSVSQLSVSVFPSFSVLLRQHPIPHLLPPSLMPLSLLPSSHFPFRLFPSSAHIC